tara:strand:+ start:258 stop:509 length:252 start_codon:yes stop_codon:yes gene_type:complete
MTTSKKIELANKMNKGDKLQITHCDGLVINEVVSHISIEREEKEVNVYHHYKNTIIHTYNEVKRYVFVVCESGAVYEPSEIFA